MFDHTTSEDELKQRQERIVGSPQRIEALPREAVLEEAIASWTAMRANYNLPPGPIEDLPEIFFTMLRRPALWDAMSKMTFALTGSAAIGIRERELLILRVGWRNGAPYEFGEHVKKSYAAGLTAEDIARVKEGPSADGWTELERALILAVDELKDDVMISDETWSILSAHLTQEQLLELPILIGQFTMVSYFQNALRMPLIADNKGLLAC
jgi:alkylhydroperoxidase family enzyme